MGLLTWAGWLVVQFANKQHASLRESVARLDSAGLLEGLDNTSNSHETKQRTLLRQILGLEIASELAVPKHPTDPAFLAQVRHICIQWHLGSQRIVVCTAVRTATHDTTWFRADCAALGTATMPFAMLRRAFCFSQRAAQAISTGRFYVH
eukprot:COSAG02_NODE_6064_length_3831_cov_5.809218_2_plen_150_part_00